jgi:hypothetical protein
MKLSFFRHSQPVCEEPKMRKIVPQDEIPREVWLKRFIESYRRSNMQMEMLSDYTKSLEQAFQHLLQENHDLKKKNALIRDYMKHLNETGDKEFELKLENRQLKTALNRSNQLLKSAGITSEGLYSDYKTAIRGQYYYIHYLKTVLHLNRVDYKKKQSFNTLEFDNIDKLIDEAVNESSSKM